MKQFLKRKRATEKSKMDSQGGWAIMSAMIAITISLIMLGGIFAIVQMTMQGSRVQEAQKNIGSIRTNVQQLYSGQPDYSGLSNDVIIDAGLAPESMLGSAAGELKNTWNSAVTVEPASSVHQFTVTYDGVPQEACIELAKFGYGSWQKVTVGGTSISQEGGGAISDATGACSSGDNSLTFTSN